MIHIGVVGTTFSTLLIPLAQNAEQLIILRFLTGLAGEFAVWWLAVTVVSVLIYFAIPESRRWLLRKREPQAAADIVNRIIRRTGNPVQPLTVAQFANRSRAAFTLLA